MNQFFSATDVHIDDKCLLDVTENAEAPYLASLGIDNMIYRRNLESGQEERFNLEQEMTFDAMALAPDASHCLIGGKNNAVLQFNFANNSTIKLHEVLGNITALKYAPSGKYIAIGSEEGKTIIYEPQTGKREKCRPGHAGSIYTITLSKSGNLLASIGMDQNVLMYKINEREQPMEVTRYTITKLEKCPDLTCSFNLSENVLFVSGAPQLQKIQCIQNRWEYSKLQSIAHSTEIIMVQVVKQNTLVTSSYNQFCVWSIRQQQKLFQIEQFCLTRVVPILGKFFGSYKDGKIYEYKREIREEEPMDIEQESDNGLIQFDEEEPENNNQVEEEQEEAEQKQIQYRQHKKSKAEKLISCFPQPIISTATSLYNENRFLFVNIYGCVIQRQEGDEEKIIEVQLEGVNKRQMKFTLAINKEYSVFSMNELGVVYADKSEFGFRPSSQTNHQQWKAEWSNIEALAIGSGWIAVANGSEIKIFDMACHEIRTISFDRLIVSIRAFENILAVVYHESVPMWESQQLSIQLYLIDSQIRQVNMVSNTHVPLTPKSLLRWFDFSREGMLFSQDTTGMIRAFSLQTSEWTQVVVDGIQDIRKVWLIGIKNHVANFWKTTDTDPEPTVAPRFQIKTSQFSISTVGNHPEETQDTYEKLLWRRYVLDHEKARTRLWGHLKLTRQKNNVFYRLSESIQTEKRIAQMHFELDQKYFPLVEKYLKAKENMRAFLMSQNCIRSIEASRRLVELFDFENQRSLAIQFEEYCDQRQKEAEYEQMQIFEFMKLREEAEKSIIPRGEDPMKRLANRRAESIPSFSQNYMTSQESVDNTADRLNTSKISNHSHSSENNEAENPFLKKSQKNDSRETNQKQISENIMKFGNKQKADKKTFQKNISK